MLSLLAPKCFFSICIYMKIPLSSVQMSKKKAYLHAIAADMTQMLMLSSLKSVRWYCNGWKSGGKTALGGYSMPKQTISLTSSKKMALDLLVHQDLPHKCISRGEVTKIKKKWCNILQHLVLKTYRRCNSASWSTTWPSESCLDIFLLDNNSYDHVIDGKKR